MSPALQQVIRFASTGAATTLLHIGMFIVAIKWWAWPPVAANGAAFVVATIFAYIVNTGWSFQQRTNYQTAFRYLLVICVNLLLAILLAAFTERMGWHYGLGLAATVLVLPPLSFLLHRTFTYSNATATPLQRGISAIARYVTSADAKVLLFLGAFTLVLHHSALNGYWRWDDGTHLLRATQYTWHAVFLDPEVMRTVSGNQIAPWNLFLYQLNRIIFGANVQGYYAHHLISLWAGATAVFALLRQWLRPSRAWVAPALLLAGMPSFQMAQQLMVGHYLYGLIFASLGLVLHIHSVRLATQSAAAWGTQLASATLYALACLCKEIYVPWVLLWVVLPHVLTPVMHTPQKVIVQALWHALPALAVAAAYTLFRWDMFEGVGGYLQSAAEGSGLLHSICAIPVALLGGGSLGIFAATLLAVALVQAALLRPIAFSVLGFALVIVVLLPLIFVARSAPNWEIHARYLWLVWLLVCVLWVVPWQSAYRRAWPAAVLVFATLMGVHVSQLRPADLQREAMFDANYRMLLKPPPGISAWSPANINGPGYLAATTYAAREALLGTFHSPDVRFPKLLHSLPANESIAATTQVWHVPCNCFRSLTELTPEQQHNALQPHFAEYILPLPSQGISPRVADQFAGPTPSIRSEGRYLHVSGATPTQGTGRIVLLAGITEPAKLLPPAAVPALQSVQLPLHPFHATLEFANPSAAQHAISQLCVLYQSHQQPQHFVVLHASAPYTPCQRYLTPWVLSQSTHAAWPPTPAQNPAAEPPERYSAPTDHRVAPHPQSLESTTR